MVVNNAGYGIGGSLEELSPIEVQQALDVNVVGTFNVVRQALPHLRATGAGHIFNISSIAALAGATGWSVYAATKAAVSAFSAVLAQDVAGFGIRVTMGEPGALRTSFLTPEALALPAHPLAAYQAVRDSHAKYLRLDGRQTGDPEKAASAIMQVATEPRPPLHLLLGADAYQRATYKLDTLRQEFATWQPLTQFIDFEA